MTGQSCSEPSRNVHIEIAEDRTDLRLSGVLDVHVASQLAAAVRAAEVRALPVCIACDDVEQLDTSSLQLLVALHRAGTQGGWRVTIDGLPHAAQAQVDLAGLTSALGPFPDMR